MIKNGIFNGKFRLPGIIAAAFSCMVVSCVTLGPPPEVNYALPRSGSVNNAVLAVKDYTPMGIIFVNSSEIVDIYGNRTGSQITYEMLMREAEKLEADDVINIRIDLNRVNHYERNANGVPIVTRTTYNYTATALAIKYTDAIPLAGTMPAMQGIPVQEIRHEQLPAVNVPAPTPTSAPTTRAPVQTMSNWISTEFAGGYGLESRSFFGVSASYERMINSYFSVGAVALGIFGSQANQFGSEAFLRVYPGGRSFFLGLGMGYYSNSLKMDDYWGYDPNHSYYYSTYNSAFGITPELGWKIKLGSSGFFLQHGFRGSLIIGSYHETDNWGMSYFDDSRGLIDGIWRYYISVGYTF